MRHRLVDYTDSDLVRRIASPYPSFNDHIEALQEQAHRRYRRLNESSDELEYIDIGTYVELRPWK